MGTLTDSELLKLARKDATQSLRRVPQPEALSKEELGLVLAALTATPKALKLLLDVYAPYPKALPGLPHVIREVELSIKILQDKGVVLALWPSDLHGGTS